MLILTVDLSGLSLVTLSQWEKRMKKNVRTIMTLEETRVF